MSILLDNVTFSDSLSLSTHLRLSDFITFYGVMMKTVKEKEKQLSIIEKVEIDWPMNKYIFDLAILYHTV